jgi:hypothetical protein
MALIISAAILSKRSAPLAAQSPTLSPTLESNQHHYDCWKGRTRRKKSKSRKKQTQRPQKLYRASSFRSADIYNFMSMKKFTNLSCMYINQLMMFIKFS